MNVVAIVGPTAAGKSRFALALAEAAGGEIVNADALQAYRGFDIGTAKPTAAELRRVAHHLVDILDPRETYSAGEFARRATAAIADVTARGRTAILVGGSGLYLRALWSGIAPLPAGEPEVRRALECELAERGVEALADELAGVDPETSGRIGRRDAQRILRALEVHRSSGVALSEWIRRAPFGSAGLPMRKVGLTLPRAVLYDRIEARAREMLSRGWVDEIRALLDSGVPASAPAFQAIGYSELLAAIEGRIGIGDAVAGLITRTRRFAKRQETWFRREPGIEWLDAGHLETQLSELLSAVGTAGGGGKNE